MQREKRREKKERRLGARLLPYLFARRLQPNEHREEAAASLHTKNKNYNFLDCDWFKKTPISPQFYY